MLAYRRMASKYQTAKMMSSNASRCLRVPIQLAQKATPSKSTSTSDIPERQTLLETIIKQWQPHPDRLNAPSATAAINILPSFKARPFPPQSKLPS